MTSDLDLNRLRSVLERQQEVGRDTTSPLAGRQGINDLASPSMVAIADELGVSEREAHALVRVFADHIAGEGTLSKVLSDPESICLLVGMAFGYLARYSEESDRRGAIRELCERAYINSGLDFDSVRRIGDLVGADTSLLKGP
jgi:hypothetical protein